MPNHPPTPPCYTPPFVQERFYLVPLAWLQAVADAGALDARELLLAQVVDGQVIFAEEQGEQRWYETLGGARPFFTRRTYEHHRNLLLHHGLLRRHKAPPRPTTVTKLAWQELHRDIKYLVADWPPTDWVYRPRTYLANRWPVWLGNSDVASRLILLAVLAEARLTLTGGHTDLPEQVTMSWRQLCTFVEGIADPTSGPPPADQVRAAVRKGIQELALLGAWSASSDDDTHYIFSLSVFDQNPPWSLPAIAQRFQADLARDGLHLHIVRDLMAHCWEPVTRLGRVWNAVQAGRRSAELLDESDLLDLQKFLRIQHRQSPPLRHDQALQAFAQQRRRMGDRRVSGTFLLTAQPIALAQTTVEGAPLQMPADTAHGLAATQVWIHPERTAGMTVAEAQAVLASAHLLIWQKGANAPPTPIVLSCHPPRPLSIDFGYVLRANQLHRRLDYARPFEVILHCQQPDPRLKLHCRFRLLLGQANPGKKRNV